jgi:hypothetical protein
MLGCCAGLLVGCLTGWLGDWACWLAVFIGLLAALLVGLLSCLLAGLACSLALLAGWLASLLDWFDGWLFYWACCLAGNAFCMFGLERWLVCWYSCLHFWLSLLAGPGQLVGSASTLSGPFGWLGLLASRPCCLDGLAGCLMLLADWACWLAELADFGLVGFLTISIAGLLSSWVRWLIGLPRRLGPLPG